MKEEWNVGKLGKLCEIYNGNSINAEYKKAHFLGATEGYPFIATKDVSPLGIIDYDNGVRIPNYNDYKVARPNSVFICAEGGSAGKKFAFVEQSVCFGNKLFCISPKTEALQGRFVYYFIQSQRFKEQFYSFLSGLIGGVSAKKFKDIVIDYPDKTDQQRIVDYLDAAFAQIDELKANAEKQLAEARALFQSALTQAMQPKPGWQEKRIKDIADVKGGKRVPKGYKLQSEKTSHPYIRVADFSSYGTIDLSDIQYVSDEIFEQIKNYTITDKDLYVSIAGTIGKTGIIPSSLNGANLTENACKLVFKREINIRFVYLFTLSEIFKKQVEKATKQASQPKLALTRLAEVMISIPSISEQENIVKRLDALSNDVKELEEINRKTATECDALKQALLRQIFE